MGAPARLPVDALDVDDPQRAVRGRGRGDGEAADEPGHDVGIAGVDVHAAHLDLAADHVVDPAVEGPQHVVVDLRQVEVHAPGAVGVDLGAGDERAGEPLVDQRVEDVGVGVQLGHPRPVLGVDLDDDLAAHLDVVRQDVPDRAVDGLDAGDRHRPAGVLEPTDVAHLAPAAGMERRAVEHHPAGAGVDHVRLVLVEVGELVTQVDGHRSRTYRLPSIWAGSVPTVGTNPAQIADWQESRPDGGVPVNILFTSHRQRSPTV